MTTRLVQSISASGVTPTYFAASGGGDKVRPGDRTFIHVKNAGGSSVTVTIDDVGTATPPGAYQFNPDLHVVVAPGSEKMVGPLTAARFNGTDSLVHITYDQVTSVTVAMLRI